MTLCREVLKEAAGVLPTLEDDPWPSSPPAWDPDATLCRCGASDCLEERLNEDIG